MSAKDGRWKHDGAWWAVVEGYENYSVSDDGRVRFDDGVTAYDVEPYLVNRTLLVRIGGPDDYRYHGYSVARLVALAHGDLRDADGNWRRDENVYQLVHIDGDVTNCRMSNLGFQRKWLPRTIRTFTEAVPVGGSW